ncbi:hypothetical protein [[Clostridium] polysaccharolyticum]|uniref:Phage transcriptional activator, RinA family n=1 Tax=[Clostridium] polysaccharolyticum TaxID=29364 RepID=A0A1H9YJ13_9FIRM|nr:hypothetical protein [[Clostridium] polysaccharolyticum]SES68976.1 hypothetical protein SAMN04487772_10242 [[Clostridium] polysaccharolyticum]
MEYRDALRELKSYPKLVLRSKRLLENIKELEQKISSAKTQQIDDMPHGSGKNSDLSDYIITKEEIENRRKKTIEHIAEIENKIYLMEDDELSEIVRLRYKDELNWSEVGNQFDKSESWAKSKNKYAVESYMKVGV